MVREGERRDTPSRMELIVRKDEIETKLRTLLKSSGLKSKDIQVVNEGLLGIHTFQDRVGEKGPEHTAALIKLFEQKLKAIREKLNLIENPEVKAEVKDYILEIAVLHGSISALRKN